MHCWPIHRIDIERGRPLRGDRENTMLPGLRVVLDICLRNDCDNTEVRNHEQLVLAD